MKSEVPVEGVMSNVDTQEPPKIEFPCDYSIRILGEAREDFIDQVFSLVQAHAPELQRDTITIKDSNKGSFMSVKVIIVATGEQQLRDIHQSLLTYDAVKMVI